VLSWKELKERRITQIVLTYLAVGWVVLAGVDQFADRQVIPELGYRFALLLYVGGFFATLVLGWYHGEKGSQKVTLPEVVLLALVLLGTGAGGLAVVRDYRADLAGPGAADSRFDPRRVAVLYFEDASDAGDLAHVADGFTESLIGELDIVQGIDVVSRNGVAPFRSSDVSPDSAGRALEAGSVIQGSVAPDGDRIRVSIRMVDAESGVDIERAGFSLPREQLLAGRDSVVARAAEFLRVRLGEEVRVRDRRAETGSVDAWTRVQRAERLMKDAEAARRHGEGADAAHRLLGQADSLFAVAEGLDPSWVAPTVGRAQLALLQGAWARSRDEAVAAVSSGLAHADRALERDRREARAWEARGALYYLHWFLNVSPTPEDRARLLDQAQTDLESAVDLDSSLASALNFLSRLHYQRKDRISAALAARRALSADAYLTNADETLNRLFWSHYDLGQFAEADRTCREAETRFPDDARFKQCHLWMMIAPSGQPEPGRAWELLARVDSLTPPPQRPITHRVTQMVVGGEVDPNQELAGYEAIMRTLLGDQDEAVQRLRRYVSSNPHHSFIEVEGDLHWWWRPLRDHPDFSAVVGTGS